MDECLGFWVSLGLRVVMGLERLVGIVRDIFVKLEEGCFEIEIEIEKRRFLDSMWKKLVVGKWILDKVREVRLLTWIVLIGCGFVTFSLLLSHFRLDKRF